MLAASSPTLIPVPFANGAGASFINAIPTASQIVGGVDSGVASMTDGFTPVTFLQTTAGGIPPRGQDFNGILNLLSNALRWEQAGAGFPYNSAFCTAIGGYPNGAIIKRSDLTGGWINQVDGNTTNPDAGGAGWLPYGGSTAILSVALAASPVTLTALQAATQIIILSGALSANVVLTFPAWVSAQWMVINQCTGGFSVTVKTPSAAGVVVAGSSNIYCTSTGIKTATVSAGTVTSVSVINANGVSASIANPTTAPALTFALGAITPTSIATTGAVTTGALTCTTFNASASDRRLKRNIRKVDARPLHRSIPFVSYELILDGSHGRGAIAQAVQKFDPHYVGTFNLGGKKRLSIDKQSMAYEQAMWAGQEIDRQAKVIAALTKRLAKLESRK